MIGFLNALKKLLRFNNNMANVKVEMVSGKDTVLYDCYQPISVVASSSRSLMSIINSRKATYIVRSIIGDVSLVKQLERIGISCSSVISIMRSYKDGTVVLLSGSAKIVVGAAVACGLLVSEIRLQ